jgi:[histone H3]-dimethyl/trimethyl-L-lysine36 demethylase
MKGEKRGGKEQIFHPPPLPPPTMSVNTTTTIPYTFLPIIKDLQSSDSLHQLLFIDLPTCPGGGTLISHLAQRALHAILNVTTTTTSSSVTVVVDALMEATWEKIHLGIWHTVPVIWREAYSLACLLHASSLLTFTQGEGHRYRNGSTTNNSQEALRMMDLAAIMGGPTLMRPYVDIFITLLYDICTDGTTSKNTGDSGTGGSEEEAMEKKMVQWQQTKTEEELHSLIPKRSLSSSAAFHQIQTDHLPSLEAFAHKYMPGYNNSNNNNNNSSSSEGQPVIVTGVLDSWPALELWKHPSYLIHKAGNRTIPVEVGSHYVDEEWGTRLMTVAELLDRSHMIDSGNTIDNDSGNTAKKVHYLAQHALFDQIRCLRSDIIQPDYCSLGTDTPTVNAWIGPGGTITPLHTDPHHNLLCQVIGRKYIRLYPPSASSGMYPHQDGLLTNTSQIIDIENNGGEGDNNNKEEERYPEFRKQQWMECVLKPGDVLYIPPLWWHYVKSLETSISVSWWWQ